MDDDGCMMKNRRQVHSLYARAKDLFEAGDLVITDDDRKADHDLEADDDEGNGGSSSSSSDDSDYGDLHWDEYDTDAEGVAVVRWVRLSPPTPGHSTQPWPSGGRVHWPALPESVTFQIVAKLPISAFCSFRSVCKEWSALIPDPRVMSVCNAPPPPPVCIMHWSACYNASTHDWQRLPTSFHPQGRRVVGACEGLLLLEDEGNTGTLWVVNPVNNSERKLPATSRIHDLKLRLKEGKSTFQVFDVVRRHGRSRSRYKVKIYDSETNSWKRVGFLRDVEWVCSMIEFKGAVYALVFEENVEFPFVVKFWCDGRNTNGRLWRTDRILRSRPHRRIQCGHLFVRNGQLMLAVVLCSNIHAVRPHMVCVWEMDNEDFFFRWTDIVAMPEKFADKLVAAASPRVDVCGDFMWISSKDLLFNELGGRKYSSLFIFSGILCHIPSNTWWELPHFRESPLYRMHYESYERERKINEHDNRALDLAWDVLYQSLFEVILVDSFFFSPRIDLVL